MSRSILKIACSGTAAIALLVWACGDPDKPVMCLLNAQGADGKDVDPTAVSCDQVNAMQQGNPIYLAEGNVFILRHELPPGVEPPEPLHVSIAAACGSPELVDVEYGTIGNQRVALLSRPAPQGSECSLVVTATIANSSLTATTKANATACGMVECPPVDAGADAGDTGP